MRPKTLLILAAVTLPVTALALILPSGTTHVPPRPSGVALLPGLKSHLADAAQLVITGPAGTLTLRRATPDAKTPAAGWTLADKGGYPVPPATIKPILFGLAALRGMEPKTDRPALYPLLDVGAPGKGSDARLLVLSDAKGAPLARVILGKHKDDASGNGHDRAYVRIEDAKRAWLAQPAITLPAETIDWIDQKIIDIDPAKIKRIVITPAAGTPLTISRAKPGDKLTVENLPAGAKLKTEPPLDDVAAGFQTVELTDVKQAPPQAATPATTAHAETFDGLSVDLALTKQGDQAWAAVSATGPGAAPITARTKGWVYEISDAKASALQTKLGDVTEAQQQQKK